MVYGKINAEEKKAPRAGIIKKMLVWKIVRIICLTSFPVVRNRELPLQERWQTQTTDHIGG